MVEVFWQDLKLPEAEPGQTGETSLGTFIQMLMLSLGAFGSCVVRRQAFLAKFSFISAGFKAFIYSRIHNEYKKLFQQISCPQDGGQYHEAGSTQSLQNASV